jgi:N-acyl-D-aspartate/D-glutamate deacylase
MRQRYGLFCLLLSAIALGACQPGPSRPESSPAALFEAPELVFRDARVMDPESGFDAIRDVGIADGMIVAISEVPLEAPEIVDASGLVLAPGFIDLHAHGQDAVSNRLQALDGVTTALELELGVYPVADWIASREGDAVIHYGASVGHLGARIKLFHDADLGSWATLSPERTDLVTFSDFENKDTNEEERTELKQLMQRGLDEGGLGFGLGITYTPGASRSEIFEIFQLASEREVPLFIHTRGSNSGGTLGAFQEGIANAAATGASLHFVHLNSSSGELAPVVLALIRGAREYGIDVTTEAYPYTAGSTRIESASYDSWVGRSDVDFSRLQWPATGERLTAESFARYREEGGWVISHGRREETNAWIVAQPDVMVASDGIPFLYGPAHPRGAGTFSRILGHYARDQQTIGLMDALKKMTLLPAQRLEQIAPAMRNKGRVRLGADADITLFDPATVLDRATYEQGDSPSTGIEHVLVSGTFVVRNGVLIEGIFPGEAIRSE